MKRVLSIALVLMIALIIETRSTRADPGARSLFFTDDDMQTIGEAVATMPTAATRDEPGSVHLDALVYEGATNWTVWLNGQRFAPDARAALNLRVTDVNEDQVTVAATVDNATNPETFTLSPGQTWHPSSGTVDEY